LSAFLAKQQALVYNHYLLPLPPFPPETSDCFRLRALQFLDLLSNHLCIPTQKSNQFDCLIKYLWNTNGSKVLLRKIHIHDGFLREVTSKNRTLPPRAALCSSQTPEHILRCPVR
ncbi:hypothetical protein ANOM_006259, partial [Aspergillus nomiae NRRL 13137]